MLREIRPAIVLVIALTLITGLFYPLAMTGIAGVIFPKQAQGSLIEKDGKVVGSALIVFTLITGVAYPLVVTGLAQVAFKRQANGSLIEKDGKVIGSELIGQVFADDKYFHGRPSATNAPDPNDSTKTVDAPYNATNSMGSNLGPTNKALIDRVKGDVDKLKQENPNAAVPIDLVTTSGSGLDPHISPEAADYQLARVAKARGLAEDKVRALVAANTEGRTFGLLGEARVNVLQLNRALDATK